MNSDIKFLIDELLTGSRILANEGVIDGFGHISARNTAQSNNYFMLKDNLGSPVDGYGDVVELDSDSNAVRDSGLKPSIERFIHGEIYRSHPDVGAVVHTHSPVLIPYGVSKKPLRAIYHMAGFLGDAVPIFDIGHEYGPTDMLVTDHKKGQSLSRSLDQCSMVLMRGHGATIVGATIKEAVFRAVYATINAQLQATAMSFGEPKYLSSEEAVLADELHNKVLDRGWDYWKNKLAKLT